MGRRRGDRRGGAEDVRTVLAGADADGQAALGGWRLFRFVEMPMMRRFGRAKPRTLPVPAALPDTDAVTVAAPHEAAAPVPATTGGRAG